jgi:hypothetical protein
VPADYIVQGGVYPITVENPYPANMESNVQLLPVYFPRPALESVTPDTVPERLEDSSVPLTLSLAGYGFRRGALVLFEGNPVSTSYCESTPACTTERLTASVDPGLLRTSGFKKISVKNPDPSVAPSQILLLRVESLQPTMTGVLPGSAIVMNLPPPNNQYSLPVVIFGTNFDPKAVVRFTPPDGCGENGCQFIAADEVISSSQLIATTPVYFPGSIGTWIVEVENPQPGGGLSQPMTFEITQGLFVPNPFVISISPGSVASDSAPFALTVSGRNFVPGSQINFNASLLQTTFVDSMKLTATVPAALVRTPGKKPVTVTNPDNGGTSNKVFLEVN